MSRTLLTERRLIVEVKAVDRLAAIHSRQVLTYLKLLDLPLGLVMNFGGGTFREGAEAGRERASTLTVSARR